MKGYIVNNWWQLILMTPLVVTLTLGLIFMLIDIAKRTPEHMLAIFFIILFFIGVVSISKAATFDYKNGLTVEARDFKTAAKHCYKKLNPVFVTEEKALEAIDICVNPVRIKK